MNMKNYILNSHAEPKATSLGGPEVRGMSASEQLDSASQTGRSMVEMLGVLAVIGILSVAGIAGYRNAMNRHRANELLNEASKRAVVVAGQLLSRDKGNLGEFTQNSFGGAEFATGDVTVTDGKFEIKFVEGKEPDSAVCSQMLAAAGDNSAMTIAEDCSSITFNKDLSKGVLSAEKNTKDLDGSCLAGYLSPECTEKVTCSAAQTWTENGCICDNGKFGPNCDSDCNGFIDNNGKCYSCLSAPEITAQASECQKCSNRKMEGNKCVLDTCPTGYFKSGSSCYRCGDPDSMSASEENCHQCPNREYENGQCRYVDPPACKWSEWFDVDFPKYEAGGGDREIYEAIRAAGGKFCDTPVDIECRSENYPEVPIEDIGQILTCSVGPFTVEGTTYAGGLLCRNKDQKGPLSLCFNYNIRVKCCDE